ncbi:hypothetical protein [Variovorax gossypii]
MNAITTGPVSGEQALLSAGEVETAIMEVANGKCQPGKLPVEAMARLIQFARAAAARSAATAIDRADVPKGYALVPLVMNREMQDVTDQEGWQWRDVLAAAGTVTEADCELAGAAELGTPSSHWHANGEADPHARHYDGERATLTLGALTDDELATGAFLNYDQRLTLAEMRDPKPGQHLPAAWMTGVKDRIRWLSRSLERALAAARVARERADLTNERIMALWDACSTPSEANGHTTGPVPFARALLALPAEVATDCREVAQRPASGSAEDDVPATDSVAATGQDVPEGFVMVPDDVAPIEPDWDECKYQAERATGLKVEPITYSVLQREIRRWLIHRARRPVASSALLDDLEGTALNVLATELGEMACTGSDAPCEDALGRLADALAIRRRAIAALPAEKRERMGYFEVQMKDPGTHAALALELAFLRHEHDEGKNQSGNESKDKS